MSAYVSRAILIRIGMLVLLVLGIAIITQASASSSLSTESNTSSYAQKALSYIAQRENIPAENLSVVSDFQRDMRLLGRELQAVTVLDNVSGRFFDVVVDRVTGQADDFAAVRKAGNEARAAKYGKLQPALYEKLQTLQDSDVISVTIMIAADPGLGLQEREASARAVLAAKYPEAREAIQRSGQPMDVADPELADKIYKEYIDLVKKDLPQVVQPLVTMLEAQGFAVRKGRGLPTITVTLPKRVIETLVARPDVGAIYLAQQGVGGPLTDSSTKTDRAPAAWARGLDGSGVKGPVRLTRR